MRRLCEDCLGAGQLTDPTECEDAGAEHCDWCDSQTTRACLECGSDGKSLRDCAHCLGNRVRPCAGCFRGQYRYWEISAQLCEVAGDVERATRALGYAIERTRLRHAIRVEWLVGGEAAKKPAKAKLEAERKRLEQELDALRSRAE